MPVVFRVTSGPYLGQEYRIDHPDTFSVGRSTRVQFSMTRDLLLSREHFQLEHQPPLCHLVDLGSTNGTKVNGLRVERALLRDGDVISAGDSEFIVHFAEDSDERRAFTTCPGCGRRIPTAEPGAAADALGPDPIALCDVCEASRKKFPRTNPDYLIEEWIGGGGMGEVYRGRQLSRGRPIAIKMISPISPLGDKAAACFRREIEVLRDLLMPSGESHPSIVTFYDIHEIDGQFHLVMEYIDGKNALDWVRALEQPLPIASAAQIGRHLLSALEYAHSKGYVHRDVKPTNLIVMGPVHRPRVKLTDFGLAKSFAETEGFTTTFTREGDVGGSMGFISPDQIRQFSEVREPADIYSAAVTLFYLMTSRYPYLSFDPGHADSYQIILQHPPVPLRAFRPDAPEGFERVLLKAMQKRPKERFKSALAMAEALRPFLASSS